MQAGERIGSSAKEDRDLRLQCVNAVLAHFAIDLEKPVAFGEIVGLVAHFVFNGTLWKSERPAASPKDAGHD